MWMFSKQACVLSTKLVILLRCPLRSLTTLQCTRITHENYSACARFKSIESFSSRPVAWRVSSYAPVTNIQNQRQSSQKATSKGKLPYEVDASVSKNVLIYSHKNSRFYKMLTVFGAVQCIFWTYLSLFSFKNLKDMPKEEEEKTLGISRDQSDKWYRNISLGEGMYKNGIAVLCFSVGYIVLFISWMYPLRAVHKLWLLKGGNSVKIMTYAWFGRTRSFSVPLENITCLQSRTSSATQIPMKVKGRWFFFLLDKKGTFHNTKLFDYTVGLMRNLK